MTTRYLFGPVPTAWAADHLPEACASGRCIPFGPDETWASIQERLPSAWVPDFVALHLAYRRPSPTLWDAPIPLVALAEDWNLLWHYYRRVLPACTAVFTDSPGVDVCRRAGITQACPAILYGLPRSFLDAVPPERERDVDVLFVGNLNAPVQCERMPWLGRVARLGERRRVSVRTHVFGNDYQSLLARARIVFNRSIRGECNRRTFEATTAGALLFSEEGNREVDTYFREGVDYVAYRDDNLEELLDYYLNHEDERRAIAEAGQRRAQAYSFERLWEDALAAWEAARSQATTVEPPQRRLEDLDRLLARTDQALSSNQGRDETLVKDLAQALATQGSDPRLHNALGLIAAMTGRDSRARQIASHFRQALAVPGSLLIAALNLVEALALRGETKLAVETAQHTLAQLERVPDITPVALDGPHFPPQFDVFRVEWEKAAWQHTGDPRGEVRTKRDLIRWRLHGLLAQLTGELGHYHEAALACPDFPATRGALGCALGPFSAPCFPMVASFLSRGGW